ncbi:3-ketoacyl-ACP reductase [Steroidobacter agaridevorans]|uniref:3-ketoacyl-ACP reductase n=1 Tax=Steroidobacter agaridevorans TaxID=2695856 RepID=A0A829Y7Q1_9GAMM|nr:MULTISPECIES: SDR family oxidoreductase [Steroidobacteraceae]GFE79230.1 3-ketoacyl-ACP reductase [Steroidobacter agaridevorans]GFE87272.1 3-ketoacyl-ACP reductase [Steroidobacter agaridevorans]
MNGQLPGSSLAGKVVVLTGGGAGIGWGIAQCCAQAGATVFFGQRNPEGEAKARQLREQGAEAKFHRLDVADPGSIREFAACAVATYGRVDALINNAGVTIEGDFLEFSESDLDVLWQTNVRSIFLLSRALVPAMPRGSAILNISSNHSVSSVAGYEMYAATKGAISAMTRAMCWSLGPRGIRVNTLSPGLTRTEAVEKIIADTPSLESTFNAMHADARFATVHEIGALAAFLVSDGAAAMTGAELIADHGLAAQLCRDSQLK